MIGWVDEQPMEHSKGDNKQLENGKVKNKGQGHWLVKDEREKRNGMVKS